MPPTVAAQIDRAATVGGKQLRAFGRQSTDQGRSDHTRFPASGYATGAACVPVVLSMARPSCPSACRSAGANAVGQ